MRRAKRTTVSIHAGAVLLGLTIVLGACSINTLAVRAISDTLAGGGTGTNPFLTDNDPELVGDAMPFALKLFDTLLNADPENPALWLTAGQTYVGYANIFLQSPASLLSDEAFETGVQMIRRAKNLYLRGRDYLFTGLALRHPGFRKALADDSFASFLEEMTVEDVPYLYWTASAWFGALSTDALDIELGVTIGKAFLMIDRAFELEPDYSNGAIHELYITLYGSFPESLGGDRQKARQSYAEAIRLAAGTSAGAHVSLAKSVSIPEQNLAEFTMLMEKALEVDAEANPGNRLLNTIRQREARWYLDNREQFFIELD